MIVPHHAPFTYVNQIQLGRASCDISLIGSLLSVPTPTTTTTTIVTTTTTTTTTSVRAGGEGPPHNMRAFGKGSVRGGGFI